MGETTLRPRVVDGVGVTETVFEVEGVVLGTTVDCEGDRVKRFWRFRSRSVVREPGSLSIVEMML